MHAETTATQPGGKLVRLVRPSVVVLCGPAACGKSTFAERHFRPTQIISSDWARGRVCDDERDQRFNAQAFALVHFLVEQRLGLNRLCVVDSTALTGLARQELLSLAKRRQVPAVAIVFDVPLDTCIERDQKRPRSVGRTVIERQYQAFDQAKTALRHEGFDQILEFRDGDIDQIQVEIVFRPVARPPLHAPRPDTGSVQRPDKPPSFPLPRTESQQAAHVVPRAPTPTPSAATRPATPPSLHAVADSTKPAAALPVPPPTNLEPAPKPAPVPSSPPPGPPPGGVK